MKNKKLKTSKHWNEAIILLTVIILFFISVSVQAQEEHLADGKQFQIPSEEKFEPTSDLITGVGGVGNFSVRGIVRLYNADGSIWYEFHRYDKKSPIYYTVNPNSEYKPFTSGINMGLALRLKSASKNWYEVFVNEDTKLTKFTLASDQSLRRDKWENSIMATDFIYIDANKNPLLETPNGQVKSIEISDEVRFTPLNIQDDWMQVKITNGTETGWIRWRKGADIWIGFLSNKWVVPKTP